MNTELLEEIGLTNSEVKVYYALLELGSSTTGKIVDKAEVASSKIYELLDKLIDKGLASYIIKSGVKHYEAAPAERILDYVEEKEKRINKQKSELNQLLPQLELKRKLSQNKTEATIYKGIKGGITAFNEVLSNMTKDDVWLAYTISFTDQQYFKQISKIHKKRSELGLKAKLIFDDNFKSYGESERDFPHTQIKYISEQNQAPAVVNIVGDTVLLNMMTEEITVIKITSKELASEFRKQFENLWNQSVTTTTGFDSVTKKFDAQLNNMNPNGEYYVLGASLELGDDKLNEWLQKFHINRIKQNKKVKFLTSNEAYEPIKNCVVNAGDDDLQFTEIKSLSPEFSAPFQINLWDKEKVWITMWEGDLRSFEIKSKEVYDNFKVYFDALWKQDTKVVRGIDAIQQIFEDMLSAGQCDFIGAKGYFMDHRKEYITKDWAPRAKKQGFKMRNLTDKTTKGHLITKLDFAKTKFHLNKNYAHLSVYWIFANKVVISNWIEKEPVAVIIENAAMYKMYKEQFELMWKRKA